MKVLISDLIFFLGRICGGLLWKPKSNRAPHLPAQPASPYPLSSPVCHLGGKEEARRQRMEQQEKEGTEGEVGTTQERWTKLK